jgi:hypothetical protein
MRVGKRFHQLITVLICLELLLQTPGQTGSAAAPAPYGRVDSASPVNRAASSALPSTQPVALADPIAISRVYSSHPPGRSLMITFTVTNNLPPTQTPVVPAGAAEDDYDATQHPHLWDLPEPRWNLYPGRRGHPLADPRHPAANEYDHYPRRHCAGYRCRLPPLGHRRRGQRHAMV